MRSSQVKLYTGNANPELAQQIAHILGIPLGQAKVGKFQNGETMVEIEVRGPQPNPSFSRSCFLGSLHFFPYSALFLGCFVLFSTLFYFFHNLFGFVELRTEIFGASAAYGASRNIKHPA